MIRRTLQMSLLIFVWGCTPRVISNVENFSDLPSDYVGKSIYLLAHPESKNDSLEWKRYRPTFERAFLSKGFKIGTKSTADYVAFASYGIGSGKTSQHLVSTPVYGQTGGGTTFSRGTFSSSRGTLGSFTGTSYTLPTYGIVGTSTSTISVTRYTRNIALIVIDTETKKKVFEGRASSTGRCGMMSKVLDEMVVAMFREFPSGSGKVVVESKDIC